MSFITDDFLLASEPAKRLYHEHAEKMGLYDFHSHLDPSLIASNASFRNLTHAWLSTDHYKWRAMRTHGIPERSVTGDADDREKFEAWAKTVPYCIGNPLYHWTHLELARIFGKPDILFGPETADKIYSHCNSLLASDNFRIRQLLIKMNVRLVCTTDDPLDSLEYHKAIGSDSSFPVRVLPTFRPDKARGLASVVDFNKWVDRLEQAANAHITDCESYLDAIKNRHDYFHAAGCRISDHAMEIPFAESFTATEVDAIFKKLRTQTEPTAVESAKFQTFLLREFAKMDAEKKWAMQLHIGALRNNNTRRFRDLGPDTGFDSISDAPIGRPLARFLDSLDADNSLPRTILYTLDPAKNETIATMLGNFQGDDMRGKMQFGSAWWFNDQKDGMERHLTALASLGLLSSFVGMSTDSRSFLSFPRHDYFRRILCNLIGSSIARGELPNDIPYIGKIVEDICYNNAKNYFTIGLRDPESDEKRRSQ